MMSAAELLATAMRYYRAAGQLDVADDVRRMAWRAAKRYMKRYHEAKDAR